MTRTWRENLADWPYATDVLGRLAAGAKEGPGGCWVWTKFINPKGYGTISVKQAMISVHRVAYTLYVGEIPPGLVIDHLCRNRACCNPWHLEPVTSAENTRRGIWPVSPASLRTSCPQGHPYDEKNTYVHPATGHRTCRACRANGMRGKGTRKAGAM